MGRCFCFDIIALVEYTAVINRELFLLDFFSQKDYALKEKEGDDKVVFDD